MEVDNILDIPAILQETPLRRITITYPNDQEVVQMGQELTPTQVKDAPTVSWEADVGKYYTLLMFDPDAPSKEKPIFASVNHWLVVNILGSNLATGDVILEYLGAGPPKGTGFHRYVFVVFEQKNRASLGYPRAHRRINFDVADFMTKCGFDRVHAGNFFRAQWDPHVDEHLNCCTYLVLKFLMSMYCIIRPCIRK